jgi:NAD(P)-dependent dehydrogenase (short-subunit alcohol dehydrogenase family)
MAVLDMFVLKDKVGLVTGGASPFGREMTSALAEAGAETYIASRQVEELEKLAKEQKRFGHRVVALALDQESESSILALRDEIKSRSGQLDILVNNAVSRPMTGYRDKAATFQYSMTVNATGLFLITRAMADLMAENGKGSIINIASTMGMTGPDPMLEGIPLDEWKPDYFFHKGGLINFTRYIAGYYGSKGIRCNSISPGGLHRSSMPEAFVKSYCARTYLGRMAIGSDVKGAVVFLASDASSYITGVNIPVDGGLTAA